MFKNSKSKYGRIVIRISLQLYRFNFELNRELIYLSKLL